VGDLPVTPTRPAGASSCSAGPAGSGARPGRGVWTSPRGRRSAGPWARPHRGAGLWETCGRSETPCCCSCSWGCSCCD